MSKKLFSLALEDDTSGTTILEKEYTFYARIDSIAPLMAEAASILSQNQFQLRIAREGSIDYKKLPRLRVRATKEHDKTEIEYTQTLKVPVSGGKGDNETTIIISESFFNEFKLMADSHMEKDRYVIAIEGREETWEIDVFYDDEGKPFNHVKVDFEIKTDGDIPQLPSFLHDVIDGRTTDPEERKFIDMLYETVFLKKLK